ncbi:right-handed parallel beta-helix repeat-containing protein [Faecalibacterium sp. Marseille-Q0746]|uniref:right-handed parallel beta-helix repeat-containing protein n=1 Tax=Faecalibacterium sp. Marseille-Q0746 TaxID=2817019 RepID=UPI001A9AC6C6|nr:right-handed parallel beta-helix repeat-containing protein [Faecalibacterium sp. Marseille-Q0746]MBO1345330.1 hypothetical protein [Faecalibacterium sp. Marseille-Q0746]
MTNKKFKLAAMSLATAVAVSTVGPSASAVTYYLGDGSVTVDQDENRGAYSYQGEDGSEEHRTYVNEDTPDKGTIYVKDGNAPEVVPPTTDNSNNGTEETTLTDTTTDSSGNNTVNSSMSETTTENTITVKEDVKDATIVVEGVNVDTSDTSTQTDTQAEVSADAKEDKTIIKVGEGADVDLTVKDSNLTTGGHGIDIGVNLDDKDDNKGANVDLTLDNTKINLTEKDNTAGIVARDHSKVDVTLKGENTIDGKKALEDAAQEAEEAKKEGTSSPNRNVEGIRVGGENAGDDSSGEGASLTIKGDETSDQGSLNIDHTSTGMVISNDSDVTLTDNADVDIKHTEAGSTTQGGRGIVQRGDLAIEDNSSLTIDTVHRGVHKIDNDQGGLRYDNNGHGIDSTAGITVTDDSTLEIKGTDGSAIYGGTGSSLTVKDSTLDIDGNGKGIDYESGAGNITFEDSKVDINSNGMGIAVAPEGGTNITFDNSTGSVSAQNGTAIYGPESNGKGKLTVTNKSEVKLEAPTGIYAGFDEVEISGKSKVTSIGSVGMMFVGGQSGATKLHVTGESEYNLQMEGYAHALRVNLSKNPSSILVDQNSKLHLSQATKGASAIVLGNGATLTMDNGTLITEGNFLKGIYSLGSNSTTTIKNGSHVDVNSIVGTKSDKGQKLIVTGGTLTYDYKADNTLWPENEQGDKLTNFLLTKDDAHANFDALSYKGQTYTYLSDLNKETGKQYLSVWVPAAALNYMLDVDGSHDPEIIGKVLEELKQAGYNFDTAYQTAENGDQVVILRDMVVNGKSLNFTKTTDAEGNTKLIWGNYEKQADGAPNAYDMVYGTEYEYEGKTYTIVWGYESQNNPNTTAAAGVLDAFGPDSNVKVTGENIDGTDSAQYTVTIYGALREVTDPVIPTNPKPETPEDSDPTPPAPAPTTPTTPAVQDARPTTPAVEQAVAKTTPAPETPVNPPVQDVRPESGKLIQTGTTNWMADVLVRAGGVLLAAGYLLERKRKSMFHKAQH